jgi:hypothetical protein
VTRDSGRNQQYNRGLEYAETSRDLTCKPGELGQKEYTKKPEKGKSRDGGKKNI